MALNPPRMLAEPPFRGAISNADPHDIGLGAATVQINLQCKRSGQLQCRQGVRAGGFANPAPPENFAVIAAMYYQRPEAAWVVYQLANGDVKTGRSFA